MYINCINGEDGFTSFWIIKQIWQSYSVENTMGNDKYFRNAFAIAIYLCLYIYFFFFLAKKRVYHIYKFQIKYKFFSIIIHILCTVSSSKGTNKSNNFDI